MSDEYLLVDSSVMVNDSSEAVGADRQRRTDRQQGNHVVL